MDNLMMLQLVRAMETLAEAQVLQAKAQGMQAQAMLSVAARYEATTEALTPYLALLARISEKAGPDIEKIVDTLLEKYHEVEKE